MSAIAPAPRSPLAAPTAAPPPPRFPRPVSGRIAIEDVGPCVAAGRLPAKAVPGEEFTVAATVFREGHDVLGACVVLRDPAGGPERRFPMRETVPGTDRWEAAVTAPAPGRWTFTVEAWDDPLAGWLRQAAVKIPAGVDTELVLREGADLLDRTAAALPDDVGRDLLRRRAAALRDPGTEPGRRLDAARDDEVTRLAAAHPLRDLLTATEPLPLRVDRERALFGSWYEFFPRSEGARLRPGRPPESGTFATAAERLPAIAAMGFDVVYLPPVHPIGRTFRKGPDNRPAAGPHDVGSPWAIGSADGGHEAVHPDLGTVADFEAFIDRARGLGLEVALDFALQCSPDHPWVTSRPRWFRHRPDGTIACAENPPKKYEDIHPVHFDDDFDGIVEETVRLLRLWAARGVRIFRVDNPHTKPVAFWEAVLGRIAATDPDVLFLAEAFTRPPMMRALAKVGFHQSYTYFTWRTGKHELVDYLTELSRDTAHFLRPNLFVNTPDILPHHLRTGGRPAFELRAVLAATLSPSWGVYAGYELCENDALGEGREEYAASEKYQLRPRDWTAAEARGESLAPLITRLNAVRRAHPALRHLRTLHFHPTDDDAVLAYSKRTAGDSVVVVVNLDPHRTRETTVHLDMDALGLDPEETFLAHDELTGETYPWQRHNYVRLEPGNRPAHILAVRRTP
ncbi:alpha-1,4-glucan--maltose-1-phosphate maltosyltransferase [Streptomyces sp. MS06]|uniref:alpha-1,4-glucan--maltose-1-phosphate maltosyltransferase n=1 Tax=Streptomyces sp. MS06 TaxID=3385974 RepID=UPI0039A13A4B